MPKKIVSDELLECKAFNHAWEPCAPYRPTDIVDPLFLTCVRCGSGKIQGIGRHGYLDSTVYDLAKEYEELKLDHPNLDRQAARLELVTRWKKNYKQYTKDNRRLRAV